MVKTVAPTISFLNQVQTAVASRKNVYNNNAAWAPYAGTIYYGGSQIVGYTAISKTVSWSVESYVAQVRAKTNVTTWSTPCLFTAMLSPPTWKQNNTKTKGL